MDVYMLALRLIHIFCGVFWVGTVFFVFGFLQPAVKQVGPDGGKVMLQLTQSKFTTVMPLTAILTVLSGALLYYRVSGGLRGAWLTSGPGIALTIGGIAGLVALVHGLLVQKPATDRIAALGQEIQSAGGAPTPAQAAELRQIQDRLTKAGLHTALLLVLALLGMSTAQYISL